ncbi:MAG: hypothetical protein ABJB12_14995 [Pseudomonadota bacterium]
MIKHRFLSSRIAAAASFVGVLAAAATSAQAQETAPAAPVAEPAPVAPVDAPPPEALPPAPLAEAELPPSAAVKPKPPPYSLPWQLRPVSPANVIRLDSSLGFYKNPANKTNGTALVSTLLGSYKVIPDLAVIVRAGFVENWPATTAPQQAHKTDFLNPVVGGAYGLKLSPDFKLGLFLGVALPMGDGGGSNSSLGKKGATGVGINTRSAFDNAMFAIDYFTVFPGVDLAFVKGGFTVQAEATILKLTKVRGPAATEDDSKVNFTAGLHAGYFVTPFFSLGAELRHQRWLSTPMNVSKDYSSAATATHSIRDTTTFAVGPRFHFKLSGSSWFRPGVSLTLPIDDPMKKAEYKVVQLDLPISF